MITAFASDDGNLGLAFISANFVQSSANPELFDLAPENNLPVSMAGFNRPAGVCNTDALGTNSGYGGSPTGGAGNRT